MSVITNHDRSAFPDPGMRSWVRSLIECDQDTPELERPLNRKDVGVQAEFECCGLSGSLQKPHFGRATEPV